MEPRLRKQDSFPFKVREWAALPNTALDSDLLQDESDKEAVWSFRSVQRSLLTRFAKNQAPIVTPQPIVIQIRGADEIVVTEFPKC
jgi:hypothetical protein